MDWLDERLFKVVVECMRISVNHACCGWFVLEFIYLFYECGDLTFYQTATDLEWKPSQECLKTINNNNNKKNKKNISKNLFELLEFYTEYKINSSN